MVIDISLQYNGGFLPDIILLTQGYFSETLRVQYGEDGVGRRKSGPIASRATSGRLA